MAITRTLFVHAGYTGMSDRRGGGAVQRQLVADPDFATGQNNAHDTGFADDISVRVALEGRLLQTRPNALELSAWVAQTSHGDDCRIAQMQPSIGR
jgi:hypothetical protein